MNELSASIPSLVGNFVGESLTEIKRSEIPPFIRDHPP